MDLGVLFERIDTSIVSVDEARIYAEILGPTATARLTAPGHVINPFTGGWFPKERGYGEFVGTPLHDNLHSTDRCIINLQEAGFNRILLTVSGASADATEEGKTSFRPYTDCGPWSWKLDADGNATTGISYLDETKGCVREPAHLKPEWSYQAGRRAALRWYGLIDALLSWNEPDGRTYWPGMVKTPGEDVEYQTAYGEFRRSFLLPFTRGVREVGVSTWGPETAGLDGLQRLAVDDWAELAWHNYAEPDKDGGKETLKGACATLDERIDAVEPFRRGRKMNITETGDNEGANGEWLMDFADYAADRGISTFIMGGKTRWIDEERDELGRIVGRSINALGRQWQKHVSDLAKRRRAVDHE